MSSSSVLPPSEWIVEGTARMRVPPSHSSSSSSSSSQPSQQVFYNPVQVQNRDLSVLMIALHEERRVVRRELQRYRKEQLPLLRQLKQKRGGDEDAAAPGASADAADALQTALDEYEATLDPTQLVRQSLASLSTTQLVDGESEAGDNNNGSSTPPSGAVILDALAASGLRSLRYWREIPGVYHITVNDMDDAAVERARRNVTDNQLDDALVSEDDEGGDPATAAAATNPTDRRGLRIHHGDATSLLYDTRATRPWTVVDLDPYGSAAPFLDAALQSLAHQGMLCVTCTDMAALGGSRPETCFGRYHSFPLQRAGYLQEAALRILLYHIATTASKYGRTIRPILSVGMDFYVRVFVEIWDSKADVNRLPTEVGHVYQSTRCPSFHVVPTATLGGKSGRVCQAGRAPLSACEETGAPFKIGGPLWLGPLHDPKVVHEALRRLEQEGPSVKSSSSTSVPPLLPDPQYLATKDRLRGLLESCRDELNDVPLYYKLPDLASALKVPCPPMAKVRAALANAGFRVSGYHKEPQALKTNAPNRVVWDVLRVWCLSHLPKAPPEGSAAAQILAVKPSTAIDFAAVAARTTAASSSTARRTVPRFPLNPQPHWGPKPRATGHRKRKAAEVNDSAEDPQK